MTSARMAIGRELMRLKLKYKLGSASVYHVGVTM